MLIRCELFVFSLSISSVTLWNKYTQPTTYEYLMALWKTNNGCCRGCGGYYYECNFTFQSKIENHFLRYPFLLQFSHQFLESSSFQQQFHFFHCHLFIQETSSCNLSFSKCYYYSGYSILFIVVTIKFIDSIVSVSSLIGYNSLDGDCHEQGMKWNGRCWVDSRCLLWNWTVYWEGR